MEHPICDAVDAGHIARTTTGLGKDSKTLPENEQKCRKDNEPWPCSTIREARKLNAQLAGAHSMGMRKLHNEPVRMS